MSDGSTLLERCLPRHRPLGGPQRGVNHVPFTMWTRRHRYRRHGERSPGRAVDAMTRCTRGSLARGPPGRRRDRTDPDRRRPRGGEVEDGWPRSSRRVRPRRAYVSLVPSDGSAIVVAERRVPFDGITNLRDLGGYPTAGGGVTRWGRCSAPTRSTSSPPTTSRRSSELGVRRCSTSAATSSATSSRAGPVAARADQRPPTRRRAAAAAAEMSAATASRCCATSTSGPSSTARPRSAPSCAGSPTRRYAGGFHCHGGKDRTGVVAAVLLLALGVDRETVLDDYEATRRYRPSRTSTTAWPTCSPAFRRRPPPACSARRAGRWPRPSIRCSIPPAGRRIPHRGCRATRTPPSSTHWAPT